MKQVTVLFCDMVNSTPLTERLGAEAMRELVHAFLETSLAEVHRYGGTAPQFTGDGFMALFGAPLTQEDHVRRAMLAALAVQRALGADGETADAERLNCRCGSAFIPGPVVFGPIADKLPMRLHGDRRHRQCRRPASSRQPSRARSWSARRPGRWPRAMPGSSRSGR